MSKILGLDLGTKTLGIAISDSAQKLAVAYENYTFPSHYYKKARAHVLAVCAKENICEIALGYPLNTDGTVGERAKSAERFRDDLLKEGAPPIVLVNETYTTLAATEELARLGYTKTQIKAQIDAVAAKYILETYLERRKQDERK
ncbi:MAG: putative Holliday junction resolvase [Tenericutes bacterium ADurb.Bin087]|nr:MAG: putative Holliday junction resolvase [Tenericutes bacterium ADurb.Bin087]